jgi:putative DNA primase/helicase
VIVAEEHFRNPSSTSDPPAGTPAAASPPGDAAAGQVDPQANGTGMPHSDGTTDAPDIAATLAKRLQPQHLADLRKSGLSDATIVDCFFLSLDAADLIKKALHWSYYDGKLGSCLAIPFFDANGEPARYCRLKPDQPLIDDDGKPRKYESPKGSKNRSYIPAAARSALSDPTAALFVTEGEKKSAKATQEGFPCIGLIGVYGWQQKRTEGEDGRKTGERKLIADLATIVWKGRRVYITFDSDAITNNNVRQAECHLAEALAARGAVVKIVRLPPGPPDAEGKPTKVGLDDFFVNGGTVDDLRKLMAEATEPQKPEPSVDDQAKKKPILEALDDPVRLARVFVHGVSHTHPYIPVPEVRQDKLRLRSWADEWLEHDGASYRPVLAKELRSRVAGVVRAEFERQNRYALVAYEKRAAAADSKGEDKGPPEVQKVTTKLITDVMQGLGSVTLLPSAVPVPAWIGGKGPFPAEEVLPTRNALIHLPSLVAKKPQFSVEPTPRFFSTFCLDYSFDLKAPVPRTWLTFLKQLWLEDHGAIGLLQEFFGYCLAREANQQKIMLIVGPKRSGKGTIARVLRHLIGPENVAGPTLSSLATTFGLWPLIGKQLAIISDARLSGARPDQDVIVERLLAVSGEDSVTIDRKHLPPVTLKLPCRFLVLSNELPRLGDASGALASRFLLLHTPRSWYGREDIELTDKLVGELPGILLWAIEGWRRLRERKRFEQCESGRELLSELEDLASPVGAFVRDCCVVEPGLQETVARLFMGWEDWCADRNRRPGNEQTFGRDLLAAVPTLRRTRPRAGEGSERTRERSYDGIALREPPRPRCG